MTMHTQMPTVLSRLRASLAWLAAPALALGLAAAPGPAAAQPQPAPAGRPAGTPAAGQPRPGTQTPQQRAPGAQPNAAPAKPGAGAPAKPGAGAPAKPGAGAPAKPGAGAPARPAAGAPARPAAGAPAKPGAAAPAKPGAAAPAKPGAGAPAQPGAAAPQTALELPELQTWELANGMKVAFLRMASAPVISVQVWYHAGSKDEPRKRRGSAHMFEHMMFKGTQNVRPESHAQFINALGGYVNATTSEDATWYINVVPRDYLDFVLQLEAERMRKLLFRDDMIRTEREVVKEEIRQQENNPLTMALLRFLEIAYTKHPYAWTAGGTIADLDATTKDDLERFYDAYYVPNNAMLVVTGAVTADEVRAAAEKWFGAIPRGASPARPAEAAPEPAQTARRREVVAPSQIGLVLGGYHIPGAADEDIYALQVAALVLGTGDSSRLTERLVRKDNLAVQTGAPLLLREHPGLLAMFAVYLDPQVAAGIEAALLDEVARLGSEGPTEDELRKARNQLQAGLAFGLEDADGVAEQIGSSWILTGDPARWMNDLARYQAVTAADVQRVAQKYLNENNLTVVVVPPASAGSR
jgi:zinc protease